MGGRHSLGPTCHSHRRLPGSVRAKPIPPLPGEAQARRRPFSALSQNLRHMVDWSEHIRQTESRLQCSKPNCWRAVYTHKALLLLKYHECWKGSGWKRAFYPFICVAPLNQISRLGSTRFLDFIWTFRFLGTLENASILLICQSNMG